MESIGIALCKRDYIDSLRTNNGGGEAYQREKAPRVELYRKRVATGRDLWTGSRLVGELQVAPLEFLHG